MPRLARQQSVANTVVDLFQADQREINLQFIMVSNRDVAATTFRIWYSSGGAGQVDSDATHYDTPLPANDTIFICYPEGYKMAQNDVVRFMVPTSTVNVMLFGEKPIV